jgi:hypothetical protein
LQMPIELNRTYRLIPINGRLISEKAISYILAG